MTTTRFKNADILEYLLEKNLNQITVNNKFFNEIKLWNLQTKKYIATWFTKEKILGLEYCTPFVINEGKKDEQQKVFHLLTLEEFEENKTLSLDKFFLLGKNFDDVNSLVEFILKNSKEKKVKVIAPKEEVKEKEGKVLRKVKVTTKGKK